MLRKACYGIIFMGGLCLAQAENFDKINEATGVNQTAEEGFGARHSGMAISFAGFQRDADAIANAPAAMNDIDNFTFSSAHAEKFGEAKFDAFAFLLPFESNSTLGLGIARYGISGIDLRPAGTAQFQSQATDVFSIADYSIIAAFARRWGGFDLGLNLNVLYRQLDQDGLGMRGDAMAQYTWGEHLRLGALLKGFIPSSVTWESGYSEYEPSDLYLGAAARFPSPYFYGTLQVAVQSEGLFQKQARSMGNLKGDRLYESPQEILSTLNLGAEFLFDFGLACRMGFEELTAKKDLASSITFGLGYNWRQRLGLDYSFTPHPDLLSTHRIAVQFTPFFPKFSGKDFRPQRAESKTPESDNPDESKPIEGHDAKESHQPEELERSRIQNEPKKIEPSEPKEIIENEEFEEEVMDEE